MRLKEQKAHLLIPHNSFQRQLQYYLHKETLQTFILTSYKWQKNTLKLEAHQQAAIQVVSTKRYIWYSIIHDQHF